MFVLYILVSFATFLFTSTSIHAQSFNGECDNLRVHGLLKARTYASIGLVVCFVDNDAVTLQPKMH